MRSHPDNTLAGSWRGNTSPAFTLIEILVVLGILSLLIAIIVPMLRGTISSARSFNCQMSLRTATYDFTVFADDVLHGPRGSDSTSTSFTLSSFQDSLYGVNEFWSWPNDPHALPDVRGNNPMRCAEVRGQLTMRSNSPCDGGGVGPAENVSFGLNARLRWREIVQPSPAVRPIRLSGSVLASAGPSVPLLWDVDGTRAVALEASPFYAAPSLDSPLLFAGDQFWHPGARHNGALNVGFIDGHVAASRTPLEQREWRWDFVPGQ